MWCVVGHSSPYDEWNGKLKPNHIHTLTLLIVQSKSLNMRARSASDNTHNHAQVVGTERTAPRIIHSICPFYAKFVCINNAIAFI